MSQQTITSRQLSFNGLLIRRILMDTAHKVIVLLATICHRIYKVTLSPLFGNACRYSPCCSDYALEAVTLHGIRLGAWLGIKRVCRCHPWHAGGLDPVPRQLNKVRIETK